MGGMTPDNRREYPIKEQHNNNHKPNYNKRAHTNDIEDIPRVSSSGVQGDCTTEFHRSPTTKKSHPGGRELKQFNHICRNKEESPKMGRQINNSKLKEKEESTEKSTT